MHEVTSRRVQGDVAAVQRAVATGADVCEQSGPSAMLAALLEEADARAHGEGGTPVVSPDKDGKTGMTAMHVAVALGNAALAEYIWQVCMLFVQEQAHACITNGSAQKSSALVCHRMPRGAFGCSAAASMHSTAQSRPCMLQHFALSFSAVLAAVQPFGRWAADA